MAGTMVSPSPPSDAKYSSWSSIEFAAISSSRFSPLTVKPATVVRCADTVEDRLHPADATVHHVERAESDDHDKGGQDEGDADERRADHSVVDETKVDRQLGRQGTRHQLGQGEPFLVVAFRDPAPLLHEVAVHVADQRDWSAEPPGAEAHHVAHQLPERVGRALRWGALFDSSRVH